MAKPASIIGAAVGRVEGADKVSGQATYGADVHFPDTLWGKILEVRIRMRASSGSTRPKRGKCRA